MADAATRRMSLDEFLRWDDGSDRRYELLEGFPIAMAPPSVAHSTLAARLAMRAGAGLAQRRPCAARSEAGILHPDRTDTFFAADLAVSCAPLRRGQQYVDDPILIVEILSPSTERHDRLTKLPAYRRIGSVQEILLINSDAQYAELHRRHGDLWATEIARGAEGVVALATAGIEIAMSELYEGIPVEDLDA